MVVSLCVNGFRDESISLPCARVGVVLCWVVAPTLAVRAPVCCGTDVGKVMDPWIGVAWGAKGAESAVLLLATCVGAPVVHLRDARERDVWRVRGLTFMLG